MAKLAVLLIATAPVIVNVGVAANGRQIHLKPTSELVIHLRANPSTGYQWKLVKNGSPVLKVLSSRYVAPKTTLIGASGQQLVRFQAVKNGKTVVKLAYRRTTHPATPPAQTYSLTVAVP